MSFSALTTIGRGIGLIRARGEAEGEGQGGEGERERRGEERRGEERRGEERREKGGTRGQGENTVHRGLGRMRPIAALIDRASLLIHHAAAWGNFTRHPVTFFTRYP